MSADLTHLSVILARPRGFCAGVVRAIEIVERALELHGSPVFVRHEIVHNRHVVERLRARGAVLVNDVAEIPEGATTIFSAHGVSPAVEVAAAERRLDVIDATCPLVRKVHSEGRRYAEAGYDVVLIGHRGHAEVEGTSGQIGPQVHVVATVAEVESLCVKDPALVAYVTQTTLSLFDTQDIIQALKRRFPAIVGQDTRDICYATQNRQNSVLELAKLVECILVVGSPNSSNANRLREIAEATGVPSHLVDNAAAIDARWLEGIGRLGISAGASTPECLVEDALAHLSAIRTLAVEELDGRRESVRFRLPERLDASHPLQT
jgi:4-hydroxy-3-methylbut-2-en-1-yl diphosphate reductase